MTKESVCPRFRGITSGKGTIDTISPVITHDNQQPGKFNTRICKGQGTAHKEHTYPYFTRGNRDRCRNSQEGHDNRSGEHPSSRSTGVVLMPRRPATIERAIPLFLIPHKIQDGIYKHGEELERVVVSRGGSHFYNISIRTRPVKRELKSARARCGTGEPSPGHNGVAGADDGTGGGRE
jgi:hypothetical protein